eukprot:scaffold9061_cov37-Attheya_sp.AAC.1
MGGQIFKYGLQSRKHKILIIMPPEKVHCVAAHIHKSELSREARLEAMYEHPLRRYLLNNTIVMVVTARHTDAIDRRIWRTIISGLDFGTCPRDLAGEDDP